MRLNLRSHVTSLLLVAAGVVFAGQSVSLFLGAKTLSKAKLELAAKARQFTSLTNSEPAPTQAAAEGLVRDLAELREAIGQAELLWRDHPISCARSNLPPPPNSRAAYFDLVRYRQTLADLARERSVEIGQDEFFGFRAYANEGPEEADILEVHTQRLVLERVLEPLLRSRPQRLLAVVREEPQPFSGRPGASKFEDVKIRHRFQIRLLGTTAVLRNWLNELSRVQLPILVSGVSVEPGDERQVVPVSIRYNPTFSPASLTEGLAEDGFELLAKSGSSEFTVTLDYVELGIEKETEACAGEIPSFPKPSPDRVVTWLPPEPQRRGPQWVFDVFTPPEIFYHPLRQEFSVKAVLPPRESAVATGVLSEAQSAQRNGLRLLGVRREEYPLQLRGYLSGNFEGDLDSSFFGLFENRESGETLLLRGGERVEPLGIEVLNFRVEERPIAADLEITTLREPKAIATIRDAQGEQRMLREGERAKGRGLIAQIERDGGLVELREGDFLATEEGRPLLVVKIQFAPAPRVVLRSPSDDMETDEPLKTEPLVLVFDSAPDDSTH